VTDEEERLVIATPGSTQRWVVHRPADPYGDGVHTMGVEVSDEGISAVSTATFEGRGPENLRGFLAGLAADWRGWSGTRSWFAWS